MIFDIAIQRDIVDENGVAGVSDNLLKGIRIAWQGLDVDSLRIIVAIQNSGDEIKAVSSSNKVILNVDQDPLTELTYINLTHLDLIAFYYTENILSEGILTEITAI